MADKPQLNALSDLKSYYEGNHSILSIIIGNSGRGKSTAIRNLPEDKTYLVNVMGKALPFMGATQRYKEGQNMLSTAEPSSIRTLLDRMGKEDYKHIEYLVIDDAQYIMATEFMSKAMVKGYDKFTIMAKNLWDILVKANKLRAGLKVFVLFHEEDTGTERRMKTLGKLTAEKLTPEGLAPIVVYSEVAGEKDKRQYYFATQSDGYTNAKSPMGMFPYAIPNDLALMAHRIDEYYQNIPLEKSELRTELESIRL